MGLFHDLGERFDGFLNGSSNARELPKSVVDPARELLSKKNVELVLPSVVSREQREEEGVLEQLEIFLKKQSPPFWVPGEGVDLNLVDYLFDKIVSKKEGVGYFCFFNHNLSKNSKAREPAGAFSRFDLDEILKLNFITVDGFEIVGFRNGQIIVRGPDEKEKNITVDQLVRRGSVASSPPRFPNILSGARKPESAEQKEKRELNARVTNFLKNSELRVVRKEDTPGSFIESGWHCLATFVENGLDNGFVQLNKDGDDKNFDLVRLLALNFTGPDGEEIIGFDNGDIALGTATGVPIEQLKRKNSFIK